MASFLFLSYHDRSGVSFLFSGGLDIVGMAEGSIEARSYFGAEEAPHFMDDGVALELCSYGDRLGDPGGWTSAMDHLWGFAHAGGCQPIAGVPGGKLAFDFCRDLWRIIFPLPAFCLVYRLQRA